MLKAWGTLGVRASLLEAHWSVHAGVTAVCFPLGYILWLAVECLMKCVFMLHLLVLYKLSLAANFHETSLRLLLSCWIWFYYSRTVTRSLSCTHRATENNCLNSISLGKGFKNSQLQIDKLILNLLTGLAYVQITVAMADFCIHWCTSSHLDLPVMFLQTKVALGLFVSGKCEGYEYYWKECCGLEGFLLLNEC